MSDGHTVTDMDTAGGTRLVDGHGSETRQRDRNSRDGDKRTNKAKMDHLKEATVSVDISKVNARAEDIIKAVTERIGKGNILAVIPKQNKEYEVTLENVEVKCFSPHQPCLYFWHVLICFLVSVRCGGLEAAVQSLVVAPFTNPFLF